MNILIFAVFDPMSLKISQKSVWNLKLYHDTMWNKRFLALILSKIINLVM